MTRPRPVCARCGCDWDAHDHKEYSAGTHCCVCGRAVCRAYRRWSWRRRRPAADPGFDAAVREALQFGEPARVVPASPAILPDADHNRGYIEAIAFSCGCVDFYRPDGEADSTIRCDPDPFDAWLKGLTT